MLAKSAPVLMAMHRPGLDVLECPVMRERGRQTQKRFILAKMQA